MGLAKPVVGQAVNMLRRWYGEVQGDEDDEAVLARRPIPAYVMRVQRMAPCLRHARPEDGGQPKKNSVPQCGAEPSLAGQWLPAAGGDGAWAARTGSGPMLMRGDIFAASRGGGAGC
jgi:hypothetical protein